MDRQDSGLVIASEADLARIIEHLPHPNPGDECYACHRKVPEVKSDEQTGRKRQTMSLSIPQGEEGVLEGMLIDVVDRFHEQWPRDHAAMRQSVGLEVVGGRCWKYHAVHFATYAVMMVPGLEPTEEG